MILKSLSVPKDGPSAGIAMVAAMASLFSGRPARGDIGMTGEVTLSHQMPEAVDT